MRDGVLKEDVGSHVDAVVAVKSIIINGASAEPAAALPPDMNTVMVIGVGGRIPVGEVVEVIVVNAVVAHGPCDAGSEAMIDVVDVRVFKREIVSVTGDGPRCIVAGNVINREVVGVQPVNAIDAVRRGKVGRGSTDIEILNDQILYGARSAACGMHGNGALSIGTASAICCVLNGAIGTTIDDDVAKTVHVNRAEAAALPGVCFAT